MNVKFLFLIRQKKNFEKDKFFEVGFCLFVYLQSHGGGDAEEEERGETEEQESSDRSGHGD